MGKKIFLKLFAGVLITSEIRMHLNTSIRWKEAQILKEFDPLHLAEVHFQDEDYAGKFLADDHLHVPELKQEEKAILERLQYYCPNLKIEKVKVKIFPQQFIS